MGDTRGVVFTPGEGDTHMTHPGYIVCDLHRRRWVVVQMDAGGQAPTSDRMEKDPEELQRLLAAPGPDPDGMLEATYGLEAN